MNDDKDPFLDVLLGVAAGDALGVPFEFTSRESMNIAPAVTMIGYGTHYQPPGTWSDDSSLTFCLAEALLGEFDLKSIGDLFVKWLYKNHWTAHGEVFDVGNVTRDSINRLRDGIRPDLAGGFFPDENGNGSLMRILPLLFYLRHENIDERYDIVKQVSSITHGHVRAVISCFYYLEFALRLLNGYDKNDAFKVLQYEVSDFLSNRGIQSTELALFTRLLVDDIRQISVDQIKSTGYVIHTLESSIWCLLTTDNYKEAVLKAVNLGSDTDTTAACTGGLAGLLYGHNGIPKDWIALLARIEDIKGLGHRMRVHYQPLS